MKIVVIAKEMAEKYNWNAFCDIVGLDPYCLNEGMDENEEFTLTEEQAKELLLI